MKTFCCRFDLPGGYCTAAWIHREDLTKEEAVKWAEDQVACNEKYLSVNDVYETTDD